MTPGHRTDTPIFRGASTFRSPSDSATTPYLLTSYPGFGPAISPETDAVETICPPSPCASISGTENLDAPNHRHQIDAEHPIPTCICPMTVTPAAADPRIVDEN